MPEKITPSEKYLLAHRLFIFLDEWAFYITMATLYFTGEYMMMIPVGVIGTILIINSYRLQWKMRASRFGDGKKRFF